MIWLRSIAFAIVFYLWTLIAAILLLPTLILPRAAAQWGLKSWAKVDVALLSAICGVRVEVRGRQYMPTGPALIAAKHQCMFDIFGSVAVLPDACYVLRKELARIPIFGWWAWKCGNIVIDREGQAKALKKLVAEAHLDVEALKVAFGVKR